MRSWVVFPMRLLAQNKQNLWYANRASESYVVDANGLKTGEKQQTYSTPVKVRMSMAISSGANNLGSQGMANLEPYGITTAYTHRAVTEDLACPMNEESRVWYGIEPTRTMTVTKTVNGETVTENVEVPVPHNFSIVRKARSLNHLIFYLKEVDVS